MTYEMAMMMNWLLVAAGLLASDAFSSLFDDLFGGDDDDDVAPDDVIVTDVDPDDGDDMLGLNTGLGAGDETSEGTEFDDTILGQAGNALFVFDAIFFRENCQRRFGFFARPGVLNIVQI